MLPSEIERDLAYCRDVVRACEDLSELCVGLTRETFERSAVHQFAVYHLLTVIGEASGSVSVRSHESFPDVPWRQMRGMRNILVHRYHRIDRNIVWLAVTRDVPPLHPRFREIVASLEHELVRDAGLGLGL